LNDTMCLELREHLDRCESDDAIRAVVLAGAGRGFCAGADISGEGKVIERKPGIAGTHRMMEFYDTIMRRIYHMPKPMIAAVQGTAVGIAWTMALACDWLLAAESAKFRSAFMNLAKVPEGGFQFLVARQVGEFKARDLVYRALPLSGAEAVQLGLATRLVPDADLMAEAEVLARGGAAMPPLVFKLTKQLFNARSGNFDAFLEAELQRIVIAANSADAKEGMAAFVGKRAANFTGT
jgi:2-(1,2-epoxy-1,2-dihydrophenyl)acetyl-CoA isomerase